MQENLWEISTEGPLFWACSKIKIRQEQFQNISPYKCDKSGFKTGPPYKSGN